MRYQASSNLSLLEILQALSPKSSKTTLRSWIKEGRVFVEEREVKKADTIVLEGQTVLVKPRKKFLSGGIVILYEDEDIVVIDKPSGLLSVSTAFEQEKTAYALLKAYYHPRPVFVVHRLDQETSGVMLFALTQRAYEKLKQIFEAHAIERVYMAVVEGAPRSPSGKWESYLYEDAAYKVHVTQDREKGKKAITHYLIKAKTKYYSLLQLTLETGKKNQIRVHCQMEGCPVVGDYKYGAQGSPLKRLCLHAHLLAFSHPMTQQELRFESPIPPEFLKIMKL